MGKRSDFIRLPKELYPTPPEGVIPLLPFLPAGATYIEPCAGEGDLIHALSTHGFQCLDAFDLEPENDAMPQGDALHLTECKADFIITNPPWKRKLMHPLIAHLCQLAPTWLLFDADWKHTKQAAPFLPNLQKVVSVGRLKWIKGSKHTGKDNCAWHLFTSQTTPYAEFYGRC